MPVGAETAGKTDNREGGKILSKGWDCHAEVGANDG